MAARKGYRRRAARADQKAAAPGLVAAARHAAAGGRLTATELAGIERVAQAPFLEQVAAGRLTATAAGAAYDPDQRLPNLNDPGRFANEGDGSAGRPPRVVADMHPRHGDQRPTADGGTEIYRNGKWEPFTGWVAPAVNTGLRHDTGKVRLDLIPPEWTWALGTVLTRGAAKYEARNWEKGMDWGRVLGPMKRHIETFVAGETYDPETRCHHLAMVAWNALALMSFDIRGIGTNDLGDAAMEWLKKVTGDET